MKNVLFVCLHTQKSLSNHDDCFNHETLSLLDTYISCILNYECEVWGSHQVEDIEKVHLNFRKKTLKVRRSTVNFIIYFEMGRVCMLCIYL
jgi:hypothetical protein